MTQSKTNKASLSKVRIDKWLWAARFFKTRSLAKQAIDGGKVHFGGQRIKSSKDVECGCMLTIRLGWDVREIEVIAVSDKRRGAPEAALLYQETEQSIEKRRLVAEQRKSLGGSEIKSVGKPTGKQRREIQRVKRILSED
ncbi:MAG: RNA-binding protein [Alteromonadaceae bacterium]|nr:MAG: RNA-binding protein [Alteromonadaceae bacterium]